MSLTEILWSKRWWLVCGVLVVGGAVFLWSPVDLHEEVLAPIDEGTQLEFGGNSNVGQEFLPVPGLREIQIPVGVVDAPAGPYLLHIRNEYFGEDVRVASVFAYEGGVMTFRFSPIRSESLPLVWVLEQPHGVRGASWVYREHDAQGYGGKSAFLDGKKLRGNLAFSMTGSRPLISTIQFQDVLQISSWERMSLLWGCVGVIVFLLVRLIVPAHRLSSFSLGWVVAGCVVVMTIWHAYTISHLPIINDEGAYVQDALQMDARTWPVRDFATKGIVYIGALKVWQLVVPYSFIAWRAFSVLCWTFAIWGAYQLAREFRWSKSVQLALVLLFTAQPAVIALTTPVLLQVGSVPLVLWGLVAVFRYIRTQKYGWLGIVVALMVLAFFARASSLIGVAVGGLIILLYSAHRFRNALTYSVSFLGVIMVVAIGAYGIMGIEKLSVLFNAESLLIAQHRQEVASSQVESEPIIRLLVQHSQTFWRGAPWLLAGLFFLPLTFVSRRHFSLSLVGIVVWCTVAGWVFMHAYDMQFLLPGELDVVRTSIIVIVFLLPIVWAVYRLMFSANEEGGSHKDWRSLVIALLWLIATVLIYGAWGRFRQNYLVEFIPPLALIAAWCVGAMEKHWKDVRGWGRIPAWGLGVGLFAVTIYQGAILTVRFPHSGTVGLDSAQDVVQRLQIEVPIGEELFTAQPIITSMGGYAIYRNYTHPGWIREDALGTMPSTVRAIYFADPDVITEDLRHNMTYILFDRRTDDIYFNLYPERVELLRTNFEVVFQVDNDFTDQGFVLYKRRNGG